MFEGFIVLLDILVVAFLIYWLILIVKGTRAEMMLWGLVVVVLVYFASERLGLFTLHWILSNFLGAIVIILVVVFQQDIRRVLMRMGRPFATRGFMFQSESMTDVVKAVFSLSTEKIGAIIVLERDSELKSVIETGIELDAVLSKELLFSIFNPQSPLHDGAVVVHGARVLKAGCILPLTEKTIDRTMGTRHRAAIGLADETDAVVIVVSEKSGEVSLFYDEKFETGFDSKTLLESLREIFQGSKAGSIFSFFKKD